MKLYINFNVDNPKFREAVKSVGGAIRFNRDLVPVSTSNGNPSPISFFWCPFVPVGKQSKNPFVPVRVLEKLTFATPDTWQKKLKDTVDFVFRNTSIIMMHNLTFPGNDWIETLNKLSRQDQTNELAKLFGECAIAFVDSAFEKVAYGYKEMYRVKDCFLDDLKAKCAGAFMRMVDTFNLRFTMDEILKAAKTTSIYNYCKTHDDAEFPTFELGPAQPIELF